MSNNTGYKTINRFQLCIYNKGDKLKCIKMTK